MTAHQPSWRVMAVRPHWPVVGAALAVVLATAAAAVLTPTSLARFTDKATSSSTLATGTLHPPTGLTAATTGTITLSWTPTTDTVASGYYVLRSPTSGSGYAQVATVTPTTATTATDTPTASGTYYYVLQTELQNWKSANSNEAASSFFLVPPVTSPTAPCASNKNVAEAGGDNDGYETRANSACNIGVNFAADTNTGSTGHSSSCNSATNDREQFWGFNLGLSATVYQVNSITVRADALRTDNSAGTNNLCVQLSWDGGTSWSTIQSTAITSASFATYTLGGAVAGWGAHAWTKADLTSPNLRVRVYDATDILTQTYELDYLAVTVDYNP